MPRILLIDPVPSHAEAFAARLRQRRHIVRVVQSTQLPSDLHVAVDQPDVVIVDISRRREEDLEGLLEIRHQCRIAAPDAIVVGVSNVYRGPRFRLNLQRFGLRLIYEY